MEKSVKLSQLVGFKKFATEFSALGEDYIFTRLTNEVPQNPYDGPFRVDGFVWILCLKGCMGVDVNLNHCVLTENSLMMTAPDNILAIKDVDWDQLDSYILFISSDFMRDINIDQNVISRQTAYPIMAPPIMKIESEEGELVKHYFDLIHRNTTGNRDDLYVRSIARCLISALIYQVLQFARNRQPAEEGLRPHSRRLSYVHQFMGLLHRYRLSERSVSFYASRLFISAKYLTLILKQTTGRSAAEWIDEFVILEAKNMLRFSGKNIQQIAYALNFPNQSSFGKYFKHLTGMSPSEYQRS